MSTTHLCESTLARMANVENDQLRCRGTPKERSFLSVQYLSHEVSKSQHPGSASTVSLGSCVPLGQPTTTIDRHRRKGLGAALAWHVARRGRELRYRFSGLQSSILGQPVYERMGFRMIAAYPSFD